MSTSKRLTEVFQEALSREITFDDKSKIILMSDCHRGDNSWSDDFAHNAQIYYHALSTYYEEGYTYIEIGDGNEMWENDFKDIRRAHSNIFELLREFHKRRRLILIYGNHDKDFADPKKVEKLLYYYTDERTGQRLELFKGIEVFEGIILRYAGTENRIFLAHGHQGDLFHDTLWKIPKFTNRHFWKNMQLLGFKDFTSPANTLKKRKGVEKRLIKWAEKNKQVFIAGHTHQPRFPSKQFNYPYYFNTGSCVHPRCITGIEIEGGKITLIKWYVTTKQIFEKRDSGNLSDSKKPDGTLLVARKILEGPKKIKDIFK